MKGPIWYSPKQFQTKGYTVPKTWDDLISLSKKIADSGTTPWCVGLESGASSGWPGTDWLEDIVIRQAGPDVYDQWWQGKAKWSSAEIKKAWQTWGTIVADPKMVLGGKSAMVATAFGDSGNPMFTNPPKCFMHHQASFITDFFTKANPSLKAGDDFNFFMTPDIDTKYAGAVTGAGDLFGMFKDTPQSRALMKYLTRRRPLREQAGHGLSGQDLGRLREGVDVGEGLPLRRERSHARRDEYGLLEGRARLRERPDEAGLDTHEPR